MAQKITIEPVTRVEGHGKVTIHLDDQETLNKPGFILWNSVVLSVLSRAPLLGSTGIGSALVRNLPGEPSPCCSQSLDVIVGAGTGEGLTPTGEKMRRLMHYGQMFQSHSLHFFHLASPDLLLGIDADPVIRKCHRSSHSITGTWQYRV